jgi:hypothetical protein
VLHHAAASTSRHASRLLRFARGPSPPLFGRGLVVGRSGGLLLLCCLATALYLVRANCSSKDDLLVTRSWAHTPGQFSA